MPVDLDELFADPDLTFEVDTVRRRRRQTRSDLAEAARAREAKRNRERLAPLAVYRTDPVGFINDFIPSFRPASYQCEALEALVDPAGHGRVAIKGPRGLGKTGLASLAILHFVIVHEAIEADWKLIATAGQWSQISAYLFPEVHKWARLVDWAKLGIDEWRSDTQLLKTAIHLNHGQATSASPARADLIEGAHAAAILDPDGTVANIGAVMVVLDESKSIPRATFDALEGTFSSVDQVSTFGYALAVSTPGAPTGKFYDIIRRRPGNEIWWARNVTLEEAIASGRVTRAWADNLARLWGPESSLFKNHVLGEFAADDESALIPTAWVEAAQARRDELLATPGYASPSPGSSFSSGTSPPPQPSPAPGPGPAGQPPLVHARPAPTLTGTRFGLDIARHGNDQTILAVAVGDLVVEIIELPNQDTAQTTHDVAQHIRRHGGGRVVVDADGMGVGVADALKLAGFDVYPFFGGGKVDWWRDRSGMLKAKNRRSAAWWNLRERLDPNLGATLMLPHHDQLIGDVTAPHPLATSHLDAGKDLGLIAVEPKEVTKKRIGRSPDFGDALVYLCWEEEGEVSWTPDEAWMNQPASAGESWQTPQHQPTGFGGDGLSNPTGHPSWSAEDWH